MAVAIVQSSNDKKNYKLVQLENGLEILLIQRPNNNDDDDDKETVDDNEMDTGDDVSVEDDEEISEEMSLVENDDEEDEEGEDENNNKQAAVALSIGIGCYSEVETSYPGLAHFLEHMLFLGSEKYPSENAFESFLSVHGGDSNGMTDCEQTTFMYEIRPEFLRESLDYFAQLFTSPLLGKESMERERRAIESEFRQAQQNDGVRLEQLMRETSVVTQDKLMQHCGWGNAQSLGSSEESKSNSIDEDSDMNIQRKMKELFRTTYSANLMKLVIQGQDSVDEMETWVKELFSLIPNHNYQIPKFNPLPCYPWPVRNVQQKPVYHSIPVKDSHQLHLHWYISENQLKSYRSYPIAYLEHLIGHESEGSILENLQERGFATALAAGVDAQDGFENGSIGTIFGIQVKLTEKGLDHYKEVVCEILSYVQFLHQQVTLPEWIYTELKSVAEIQFQFKEEKDPMDYVTELSTVLQDRYAIAREDILRYENLVGPFQPDQVRALLKEMTAENVRIDLLSPKNKDTKNDSIEWLKEPWFETQYYVSNDFNLSELMEKTSSTKWSFPLPNNFVPTNFDIIQHEDAGNIAENDEEEKKTDPSLTNIPQLIWETNSSKLYYAPDLQFHQPKVYVCFILATSKVRDSYQLHLTAQLMVKMIRDALTPISYQASLAKLHYHLAVLDTGLELTFSGFSQTLLELIQTVVQFMKDPKMYCTPNRFDIMKENLLEYYRNANLKVLRHATYNRLQLLKDRTMSFDKLLKDLESLSFEEVQKDLNANALFEDLYIQSFVHGNWTATQAKSISQQIENAFVRSSEKEEKKTYPQDRIIELPSNKPLKIKDDAVHPDNVNNAVHHYFQIPPTSNGNATSSSLEDEVLTELLERIIFEPLFDTLRTKEQLGYVVEASCHWTSGVLGFSITVQSSEFSVDFVQQRIQSFLTHFCNTILPEMTEQDFNTHVQSCIHSLLEPDSTLGEVAQRHWDQILCRHYHFNPNREKAEILRQRTSKKKLLEKCNVWFSQKSLQVHIQANGKVDGKEGTEGAKSDDGGNSDGLKVLSMDTLGSYKDTLSRFPNLV